MSFATRIGRRSFVAGVVGSVAWLSHSTAKASLAPARKATHRKSRTRDLIMRLPEEQVRALGNGLQKVYVVVAPTGHWQLIMYGDKTSAQPYQMLLRISFDGPNQPVVLDEVFARGSSDQARTLMGHSPLLTKHFGQIRATSIKCC